MVLQRLFTIRRLLSGAFALLGATLLGALGLTALQAHQQVRQIDQQAQAMLAAVELGVGLASLAHEGFEVRQILSQPQAATAEQRAALRHSREASQAMPQAAAVLLARAPAAEGAAALSGIAQDLEAWRRQADAQLSRPANAREAAQVQAVLQASQRLPSSIAEAWMERLPAAAGRDAELLRGAETLRLGWRLRESAGMARAAIAQGLAAGRAPSAAVLAQIDEALANATLFKEMLTVQIRAGAGGPAAIEALERLTERFSGPESLLEGALLTLDDWRASQRPELTAAEWMIRSERSFMEILGLKRIIADAVRSFVADESGTAWLRFVICLAVAAVGLVFVLLMLTLIHRRVTAPLLRLTGSVGKLAAGDEDVRFSDTARQDEIGELACAMAQFQEQQREAARQREAAEAERTAARLAQDEALRALAERIESQTREGFATIQTHMDDLRQEAEGAGDAAARIAGAGQQAGDAASDALSASDAVASATTQLASSVREISARMEEAARLTGTAATDAEHGETTMRGLAEAVERIGGVAQLITDIAGRTNLLALNATIESARAGDAGKGFAVVASEVKNLASQTARATEEIALQIAAVQSGTERAVTAIAAVRETVQGLSGISGGVAAAITEQSAATQEIARAVAQAADGTRQIATRVAGLGEEAGTGAARAERMRGFSDKSAEALEAARRVIMIAVREASAAVDRRRNSRLPMQGEAQATFGGQSHAVRLVDVTTDGVGLRPAPQLGPVGASGSITIADLGSIRARIIEHEGARTRLALEPTAEQAARLTALLAPGMSQAA